MQMNITAIILAKKESKRLPNKNILKIHDKTLVEYSIDSALNSKYINKIVVSSDSNIIKQIVNRYRKNVERVALGGKS
jgi:CMP-N-acetylneuraminic acid synthetase